MSVQFCQLSRTAIHHEQHRQAAVDASGATTMRGASELDWIVNLIASKYSVPLAALSIIDRNRQVIISRVGTELCDTPRADAFCAVAIHTPGEALIIPDAQLHPRFNKYRIVTSEPHVRFYAGMPIVSREGYALGALCIADTKPRPKGIDTTELMILARQVERIVWR